MNFCWRRFEKLSLRELHDLLQLRCAVFVVEQNCAFLEIDGRDPDAEHLLAWAPGVDGLAGCLRIFPPNDGPAQIGRIVTVQAARSIGLGRAMMREAIAHIVGRYGPIAIDLSAQAHLERFYASFGFTRISDDYLEDGIPHCDMQRPPSA